MKEKNKAEEMSKMVTFNNGADVQQQIKSNPYYSYLAGLNQNESSGNTKDNAENVPMQAGEASDLSLEAALLAPQANQENQDKKAEDQRVIDEKRDKAMNDIDAKMMNLLTVVKRDKQQKAVAIENFDKAKEEYQSRPSSDNYTNWSKPSMLVLENLSQESRLPLDLQQSFGDLLKEYQQIMSPQFEKEALTSEGSSGSIKSAWQNALGLQGLKLSA
ncbi:MAG: hypothetical protein AB2L14_06615 [Candidatus Xenobiia bacterium LiM19]